MKMENNNGLLTNFIQIIRDFLFYLLTVEKTKKNYKQHTHAQWIDKNFMALQKVKYC